MRRKFWSLLPLGLACAYAYACASSKPGAAEGPSSGSADRSEHAEQSAGSERNAPAAAARAAEKKPASAASLAPGKAPVAPVALEEYFQINRVRGASFSFDEKLVSFVADMGGRLDVWVAPLAGGAPKQITKVSGFIQSQAFSPTADQLVYESDQGGNELPHIYLTNSKGDAPVDLMAGDPSTSRTRFIQWAEDGKSFLYLSSRRDQQYLDLYEYVIKTRKSQLLWKSSGKISFQIASRDGTKFVLGETISDVDINLYLLERGKKGDPVLLTPHTGTVLYAATEFSKDAKTLYYMSDEGQEYAALYSMDLASKKPTAVLTENWDVEDAMFSKSWKYFVTNTNVDGTPRVLISDATTKERIELPGAAANTAFVPLEFSKSDRYLAAMLVSDAAPTTVAVIDLKEQKVTKLIDPLPESLRRQTMVSAKSFEVESFDGRHVQAFIFSPPGDGPFPAVIDVHGGPTAQSRREFNPMRQYLVSKGYVVLVPNVRGSTGYGKSFTKLDNLDLGGGPLKDVIACKNWIVEYDNVDKDRVAIMGGSYGGYMTLAAATFAPTEFAAHVDIFGVSDLKSLVESFPPYWAAISTFIYEKFGDPKNPAHAKYQHDRSPLNFVDKIERPLFVVQGENDARVKKDQSDRIVEKLKSRKVPVHYLVIPGEGHGFSQNANRLVTYQAIDRFLDRYLFRDDSIEVLPAIAATSGAVGAQ